MADRHNRHPVRSRSPPLFNPTRVTLPINLSGNTTTEVHLHAVPTSRQVTGNSTRSSSTSTSTISNAGTVTTTYKVKTDPRRAYSVRGKSRTRRSTLDNSSRPVIIPTTITSTPRHVHAGQAGRSESLHRSSEEDYVMVPATSRHGDQHHRERHNAHMDTDIISVESEREGSRIRVGAPRETAYTTTRTRPLYTNVVRHPDTVADDYGEDGYGYTNPRDLVQYDLDHSNEMYELGRRESFDVDKHQRPNSISSFSELVAPKYYDSRERRPPPSTRGFDRIRVENWDPPLPRSSIPSAPALCSPVDPTHRLVPVDTIDHSFKQRLSSYHDREPRPAPREEIYEVRDSQRRERIHPKWRDGTVEQRGFGIRSEQEHKEHREHSRGFDALATGLGIAGAALGLAAVKNASREETRYREEREERKRKESKEENWRQRERDNVEPVEMGRGPKEPKFRDEEAPSRHMKPLVYSSRERDDNDLKSRFETLDPGAHDTKERRYFKDDRQRDPERREGRKYPSRRSASESSGSEGSVPKSRRKSSRKNLHTTLTGGFNPKNTSDLKDIKQALNSKDSEPKPTTNKSSHRSSKDSASKEITETRITVVNDREPAAAPENKHARVVSPPREKSEEKPVKGILRQPREKFPEDPAPVREGVAPLKDAKKDGIPPDARWTKISRSLVNPESLEVGKERFEAREDFVIVLRVLSKEEVQAYAELTQKIRASNEEREALHNRAVRRYRRERDEHHDGESRERRRRHQSRDQDSYSDSDDTAIEEGGEEDMVREKPMMLETTPKKKTTFQEALMSGGLGEIKRVASRTGLTNVGSLQDTRMPSQYAGYTRNPPAAAPMPPSVNGTRKDNR